MYGLELRLGIIILEASGGLYIIRLRLKRWLVD